MRTSEDTQSAFHEATPAPSLPQEELWRADLYDVLSNLLSAPPSKDMLAQLAALSSDQTEIGRAVNALARVSQAVTEKSVKSEYNSLFIGLGRGELLPYGSFYLTGFLNEKPLAKLRQDMSQIGVARDGEVYEPEDHIATVCEIMSGMIRGRFGAPSSIKEQKQFFDKHLAPWAEHFFTDLEAAETSLFYAPVGSLGRALISVEAEAFRMET